MGVDEIVVTVKEVHLNEPLKPADFDMPFPADAYVTDNISGRRYTLSDRATPSSDSATIDNDGIILTPQDLVPTPPATHHQLNNAAKPSR